MRWKQVLVANKSSWRILTVIPLSYSSRLNSSDTDWWGPPRFAMRRFIILSVACILTLTVSSSAKRRDALQLAANVLDAHAVKTLQFSGTGMTFTVGQNFTPSD